MCLNDSSNDTDSRHRNCASIYTLWIMTFPYHWNVDASSISPQYESISNKSLSISFLCGFSRKTYWQMEIKSISTLWNNDFAGNNIDFRVKVAKKHSKNIIPLPENQANLRKNTNKSHHFRDFSLRFHFPSWKLETEIFSSGLWCFRCSFTLKTVASADVFHTNKWLISSSITTVRSERNVLVWYTKMHAPILVRITYICMLYVLLAVFVHNLTQFHHPINVFQLINLFCEHYEQ